MPHMYQEGMKSRFSYLMRLSWESRVTARCLKMAWGSREKRLLNLGDGEEERQGDGSCIQVGACVVWNSHQYWKK